MRECGYPIGEPRSYSPSPCDKDYINRSVFSPFSSVTLTALSEMITMFDLVLHNGYIVTSSDILPPSVYIGVKDGVIHTMSTTPLSGTKVIDAEGGMITPGGIDAHVHLEQDYSDYNTKVEGMKDRVVEEGDGSSPSDTFESGSRSAIAGGTTSFLSFAVQEKGNNDLLGLVERYHTKPNNKGTYCDYGFHLIVSDPTPQLLSLLPEVVEREGITSLKIYTTYPGYKLNDSQVLEILLETRKVGMTTMIHAENSDIIDFINNKLQAKKMTDPYFHTVSRPLTAEDEAS